METKGVKEKICMNEIGECRNSNLYMENLFIELSAEERLARAKMYKYLLSDRYNGVKCYEPHRELCRQVEEHQKKLNSNFIL